MSANTQIYDPKTGQTLCCYAIGNGNLGVVWQEASSAAAMRRVTLGDAQALLDKCRPVWSRYHPDQHWEITDCSGHFEFRKA